MDAHSEKDLKELEEALNDMLPQVKYHNAPETLEAAVERILKVEMLLEDLSRAVEIVSITRQIDMLDSFKSSADAYLEGKIQIEQPSSADMKLTVIEGEVSKETQKALQDKYAQAPGS